MSRKDCSLKQEKSRIVSIDLLRSGAILFVVLCHSTERIYQLNVDFFSKINVLSQIFALTAFTIGRLGVPIFIFISGFLLLSRKYDQVSCVKFWKKNWLGLLITTEIWIVLYNIFLAICNGQVFDFILLLKNMFFFEQVALSHMWYMPMIIGIYIFIPFVANALQSIEMKMLKFPLCIVGLILFVLPIINVILAVNGKAAIHNLLTIEFSGGTYGFMLILGYLFKEEAFKSISSTKLVFLCSVSFLGAVALQLYAYQSGYTYNIWYNCGFLVLSAATLFELGIRIKELPFKNIFRQLATDAFGIFLVHNPVMLLITKYIQLGGALPVNAIVLFVITILVSWSIVYGIGKIAPKVGHFLFFIK